MISFMNVEGFSIPVTERRSDTLRKTAEARHITNRYGEFYIAVYESNALQHLALVKGDVRGRDDVPVRIQSACLPGTALDSADCDCREQLEGSLEIVSQNGNGIVLYMDEEGRGLGLTTKVQALANKNKGLDTFEAVRFLGKPEDVRDFLAAANIIKDLGIASVQLITNNPAKISSLQRQGVVVNSRIAIEIPATDETRRHLLAKKQAGHFLAQFD